VINTPWHVKSIVLRLSQFYHSPQSSGKPHPLVEPVSEHLQTLKSSFTSTKAKFPNYVLDDKFPPVLQPEDGPIVTNLISSHSSIISQNVSLLKGNLMLKNLA
jgi:hypothetical protein